MLKTRIITALVLMIGFLMALFNTSGILWSFITLAAVLIGIWEWSKLIKLNHTQLLVSVACALVIGLILTLASMTSLGHYSDELVFILLGLSTVFWIFVAPIWLITRKKINHQLFLAICLLYTSRCV